MNMHHNYFDTVFFIGYNVYTVNLTSILKHLNYDTSDFRPLQAI